MLADIYGTKKAKAPVLHRTIGICGGSERQWQKALVTEQSIKAINLKSAVADDFGKHIKSNTFLPIGCPVVKVSLQI